MSLFFKETTKGKAEQPHTLIFKPLKIHMTEELYRRQKEEIARKKYTKNVR